MMIAVFTANFYGNGSLPGRLGAHSSEPPEKLHHYQQMVEQFVATKFGYGFPISKTAKCPNSTIFYIDLLQIVVKASDHVLAEMKSALTFTAAAMQRGANIVEDGILRIYSSSELFIDYAFPYLFGVFDENSSASTPQIFRLHDSNSYDTLLQYCQKPVKNCTVLQLMPKVAGPTVSQVKRRASNTRQLCDALNAKAAICTLACAINELHWLGLPHGDCHSGNCIVGGFGTGHLGITFIDVSCPYPNDMKASLYRHTDLRSLAGILGDLFWQPYLRTCLGQILETCSRIFETAPGAMEILLEAAFDSRYMLNSELQNNPNERRRILSICWPFRRFMPVRDPISLILQYEVTPFLNVFDRFASSEGRSAWWIRECKIRALMFDMITSKSASAAYLQCVISLNLNDVLFLRHGDIFDFCDQAHSAVIASMFVRCSSLPLSNAPTDQELSSIEVSPCAEEAPCISIWRRTSEN
jgi:hypothetical protein